MSDSLTLHHWEVISQENAIGTIALFKTFFDLLGQFSKRFYVDWVGGINQTHEVLEFYDQNKALFKKLCEGFRWSQWFLVQTSDVARKNVLKVNKLLEWNELPPFTTIPFMWENVVIPFVRFIDKLEEGSMPTSMESTLILYLTQYILCMGLPQLLDGECARPLKLE